MMLLQSERIVDSGDLLKQVPESNQCWCSNTVGRHGTDTQCLARCKSDTSTYCGSPLANDVYAVNGKSCVSYARFYRTMHVVLARIAIVGRPSVRLSVCDVSGVAKGDTVACPPVVAGN